MLLGSVNVSIIAISKSIAVSISIGMLLTKTSITSKSPLKTTGISVGRFCAIVSTKEFRSSIAVSITSGSIS